MRFVFFKAFFVEVILLGKFGTRKFVKFFCKNSVDIPKPTAHTGFGITKLKIVFIIPDKFLTRSNFSKKT
jgi:hypothetical protein